MDTAMESDQMESSGGEPPLEEDHREPLSLLTQKKDKQCPESYRVNSPIEIHMLKIADNFQRQFSVLFPERKPLLLAPLNECGVKKFVSTTLGPTMIFHPELYTWGGCASFVADFLTLVPLDPPEELPTTLFSPTSVMQSRRATCFEFATLLCSLLIGANYNAYCVSGFAVEEMCLLDQTLQECPLLKTHVNPQQEELKNKYALRPKRALESHFLMQEEKKKQDTEAPLLEKQKVKQVSEQLPADPLRGLRRHCWVLVLSGCRNIQENFFIDPLTGNSFSTGDDNFLGIESVWDNTSYYVNVQDCSNGCTNMVYDLEDLSLWEPVLFGATTTRKLIFELSQKKESKMRIKIDDDEARKKKLLVFNIPRSWVNDITISKKDLEDRWPEKKKVTLYKKAKLERFAFFLRPDGLIRRLTTYKDLNCESELGVKEWFQNRRDHLEEREVDKVNGITCDRFKPGRAFHLLRKPNHRLQTQIHRFTDTEQEMLFSELQMDNLVQRVMSPSELKEYYEGRTDHLYLRYAFFKLKVNHKAAKGDGRLMTVVERFHRNPLIPANKDVAKRVFLLAYNRIEVTYHLDDHRVIPSKMRFTKPRKGENFKRDMTTIFQVDPAEKPPSTLALCRMFHALREEESRVVQEVLDSRHRVREIVNFRQDEDKNVELSFSPWTTIRSAR
ncbi:dynein regulatory complex subunit 7-like [Halichoeres trimaculatus]|uniref:dynein regulatory complex subunit 7-like n=1 Tax=Halichoeres trimaculatus TaxID=147232 RepID=UPI003D9E1947